MKELEIERKFLMEGFPEDLECYRHVHIEQGYVSIQPEVRIHRAKDLNSGKVNYRLTMKGEGSLTRTEIKTELDQEFYDEAVKLAKYPMIQKDYRCYRLGKLILEVCYVDPGTEHEFYYGEIEFESEEEANAFFPISCMGKEVTDDNSYKMKNYWARTRMMGNETGDLF